MMERNIPHRDGSRECHMVDDWKPDPRTIRLCIEALPKWVGHVIFDGTSGEIYRGSPHKVLEEMLPDPAEELARSRCRPEVYQDARQAR